MEEGCVILLIDLTPTYVMATFEFAKCYVEKVSQCRRLCNCVNSHILEGYPRVGDGREGVVKLF